MLSRWPILSKLMSGVVLLAVIIATLLYSSLQGSYSFRELTKSVKVRATELPLASALTQHVCDLRVTVSKLRQTHEIAPTTVNPILDPQLLREQFRTDYFSVTESLRQYKEQLASAIQIGSRISDIRQEQEVVQEIERSLERVDELNRSENWFLRPDLALTLDEELGVLQHATAKLPGFLSQRMDDFAGEARLRYRTWIALSWITTISAVVLLSIAGGAFLRLIFRPLKVLVSGSRLVAAGNFNHRIELTGEDEVAELAGAMNDMTRRFQEVRDDLDQQVKQRTKEVVRSEQLASVGFLAAGVAHEINNPLASIAWAAEALEDRMQDIILADDELPDGEHNEEVTILRKYLRRIQDEAFRCKGITERLLDYSRMGDADRHKTNMSELVEGVSEMVRHLGKYREKNIEFECREPVFSLVNPQELKQVALNLITNGLDSLDPGGTVKVCIRKSGDDAEMTFTDDGCGMTKKVIEHLFEPFFTAKKDGQGTGLGLSITYRIIDEHGGKIVATSDGPGKGSRFRITLPLVQHEEKAKDEAA